jgi:hypothetical protein
MMFSTSTMGDETLLGCAGTNEVAAFKLAISSLDAVLRLCLSKCYHPTPQEQARGGYIH